MDYKLSLKNVMRTFKELFISITIIVIIAIFAEVVNLGLNWSYLFIVLLFMIVIYFVIFSTHITKSIGVEITVSENYFQYFSNGVSKKFEINEINEVLCIMTPPKAENRSLY
ncbi:MAG: hypothetical protein K9H06_21195, partial [Melioribacteraceae bacterium]|nr:hypothetical protein [Melioribacteraceae bacterium]